MSTVAKWGNSLAVCVSGKLADAASLHRGSVIELSLVAGALVVRPAATGGVVRFKSISEGRASDHQGKMTRTARRR